MTFAQIRSTVRRFWRANPLVALMVSHTAIGFGLSALFVGALIGFDLGGMGGLLGRADTWPFAIVLWFFTGLTFASVQMGIAIMNLASDGGDTTKHLKIAPQPASRRPARVRERS